MLGEPKNCGLPRNVENTFRSIPAASEKTGREMGLGLARCSHQGHPSQKQGRGSVVSRPDGEPTNPRKHPHKLSTPQSSPGSGPPTVGSVLSAFLLALACVYQHNRTQQTPVTYVCVTFSVIHPPTNACYYT